MIAEAVRIHAPITHVPYHERIDNGFVNFVEGLAFTSSGTVTGARSAPGNIGLVSQSGGAAQVNVMWRAQELGLNLSRQVSCGNCADLRVLDFVSYMVDDPHTDVIMVLVEDFGRGQDLFEVASRAADREKPIIVLKLGRTEAGSRAAASHTGAITGSDAVHDAVFKQCGMIRVNDCNELYERAMMFRRKKLPNGRRAAALSISGGNAAIIADLGEHLDLPLGEPIWRTGRSGRRGSGAAGRAAADDSLQQPALHRRVHLGVARADRRQRLKDLAGAGVLGQVTARPRPERGEDRVVVAERRQHLLSPDTKNCRTVRH